MPTSSQNTHHIKGRITNATGAPLAGLKVIIYDVDMREWHVLAEAFTDRQGWYLAEYSLEILEGRGVGTADLAVKVFAEKGEIELYSTPMDSVLFNADEREEIHVQIDRPIPQSVEFDRLNNKVVFLAKGVSISDLEENDNHQDLTFLARELEVKTEKIEHLVVAHRLNKRTDVNAAFFYALLRQHTAGVNGSSFKASVGLNTDIQTILYALSVVDFAIIRQDLQRAVNQNQVASSVVKNADKYLESLSSYTEEAMVFFENEYPAKAISWLATAFGSDQVTAISPMLSEGGQGLDRALNYLLEADMPEVAAGFTAVAELNFGASIIPAVMESKGIVGAEGVASLARMNTGEWMEAIATANPDLQNQDLVHTCASTLTRKLESEFPTIAFAAQLDRETETVFEGQGQILNFLNDNPRFDLKNDQIESYLDELQLEESENASLAEGLTPLQRVFRLTPHYGKAKSLYQHNIHSSYNIVAMGEDRFVQEVAPNAGLEAPEAREMYAQAENTHMAALLTLGDLQDSASVVDLASFETGGLGEKFEVLKKQFPNLKNLFALTDTCECTHCRSVYSPAAYLVEILQFLQKRTTKPQNARDVLFSRRPDLGEIDLSCSNAKTPLKYIDLVCEILEEAVAPDPGLDYSGNLSDGFNPHEGQISSALLARLKAAGFNVTDQATIYKTSGSSSSPSIKPSYLRDKNLVFKVVHQGGNDYKLFRLRQTFATAEELDAAPEYLNKQAYKELKNSNYAFGLPFDLHHVEASAYFDRFGVKRAEVMEGFLKSGTVDSSAIAAERLGLTDAERKLIFEKKGSISNNSQQRIWNVPTPWQVVDYLQPVNRMLNKTALSFKQLESLLALQFIDKDEKLNINWPAKGCDTSKMQVTGLDLNALDRIHRFLRLQKKLGWKFSVLDHAISHKNLGNGALNDKCLKQLTKLQKLHNQTGIAIEELVAFFGEVPFRSNGDEKTPSLYNSVFLNPQTAGEPESKLLPEAVDGSTTINSVFKSIASALQMNEQDLNQLISLLPNGNLTHANLSFLFAGSQLTKALKIEVNDLKSLAGLTGIKVFQSPDQLITILDAQRVLKTGGLGPGATDFILNHRGNSLGTSALSDAAIQQLLTDIQAAFEEAEAKYPSKYNELLTSAEQEETLAEVLAPYTESQSDMVTLLSYLDRSYSAVAKAKKAWKEALPNNANLSLVNQAIDDLDKVTGNDIEPQRKALVKAVLNEASSSEVRGAKSEALINILAEFFELSPEIVGVLLNQGRLRNEGAGNEGLGQVLMGSFTKSIDRNTYTKAFSAIELIQKMGLLISQFELSQAFVSWYLTYAERLSWFELDGLHTKKHSNQAGVVKLFKSFLDFVKFTDLNRQLRPVKSPDKTIDLLSVFKELANNQGPTKEELMSKIAWLTAYEKKALSDIDTQLFGTYDKDQYRNVHNWERLLQAANHQHRLSASVSEITKWIKPVLEADDVQTLRYALNSKYDKPTWHKVLGEIMNEIRPQKRDALVAHLVATRPEFTTANDLYEHYLIDVEMETCMPSSRIVQAHNSIQLFIQRCLMGLESDAIVDLDADRAWNQWKWMKNYRVWEANRKVFLYPENWYDVTLSNEKTEQFKELIEEAQQEEMSEETAEKAIRNYLEKLDNLAFLQIAATWYDAKEKVMHVFGKTKGGDPDIYYYRRFESERYWTPWQKVELDITGDHLLAYMRNDRLHLAWPVFSEEEEKRPMATIPDSKPGAVSLDSPKVKIITKLAISEFSNDKWSPKRMSRAGIVPKSTSFDTDWAKHAYNLLYDEYKDQIVLFQNGYSATNGELERYRKEGAFRLDGCKGYPEPIKLGDNETAFPDFYPDFGETYLASQAYHEDLSFMRYIGQTNDPLKVKNLRFSRDYKILLNETPNEYKITFPHQETTLDLISRLFSLLQSGVSYAVYTGGAGAPASGSGTPASGTGIRPSDAKRSLGAMLPYFKEDSKHAYVVVPGFYKKEGEDLLTDADKRTASDIIKLRDKIAYWGELVIKHLNEIKTDDKANAIYAILSTPVFMEILRELARYEALDFVLEYLIGKTNNPDFDNTLKALVESEGLVYGEQFKNMYHPLVCHILTRLNQEGIDGIMDRDFQLYQSDKQEPGSKAHFDFEKHYEPNTEIIPRSIYREAGAMVAKSPVEDFDFSLEGSYSTYNWDVFYRIPMYIAAHFTQNQQFEEAMKWYHYMFNPTGAHSGKGSQKYWVTKPFYLNQDSDYLAQRIDMVLQQASSSLKEVKEPIERAIEAWRKKPFRPDVVAMFRPVAYQKALLMNYVENLMEWGDFLFRQDSMESIAQATQLYVMAEKLLGPKLRVIPAKGQQPMQTYNQIEADIDGFGNALVALENRMPVIRTSSSSGLNVMPLQATLASLFFCVPANPKIDEFRSRVADRLFKIRNCQNLDGVARNLALFAPPIDPGVLVKAAGQGLSLSSVIAGLNAPTPLYRFYTILAQAKELVQQVQSLGQSLLQALEKRDSERFALFTNELEAKTLEAVSTVKKKQIEEAEQQIEVLKETRKLTDERYAYYRDIAFMNAAEITSLSINAASTIAYTIGSVMQMTAGGTRHVPEVVIGASGFGGSPHATAKVASGDKIAESTKSFAQAILLGSQIADRIAGGISTIGSYQRRFDDWKLQERLAKQELEGIEKQIKAAELRRDIAKADFRSHETQVDSNLQTREFMDSKFTNKELYDWMSKQVTKVYFKSYKLAFDFAKKAEQSYRFELGNDDRFISSGYWESGKKGLQTADHLLHDLNRMESAYMDKNKREYEVTKHISLAQLDPLSLVRLKATGTCDFEIPEVLFDMDHPGQYFRRMKSVSITIPCIAGPYTSVSAKLSLVKNRYRKDMTVDSNTGYAENAGNDGRFVYNVGSIQSIATSQAQNDSGLFELNFRDERYLPFEGCGSISTWRLELPTEVRQFDYSTISDIIVHMRYTAREGGSGLKKLANQSLQSMLAKIKQSLSQEGLHTALHIKHDLPNQWHLLKQKGATKLTIGKNRLPYMAQGMNVKISQVMLLAKMSGNATSLNLKVGGMAVQFAMDNELKWLKGTSKDIKLDQEFDLSVDQAELDKLDQVLMVVKYELGA